MADDLCERIRAGDLAALSDPALPLHLLVEPDAALDVLSRYAG